MTLFALPCSSCTRTAVARQARFCASPRVEAGLRTACKLAAFPSASELTLAQERPS